jgi:acetate kinase
VKILVLNCGSSSIKYQLFDMPAGDVLAKGLVQRIGEPEGKLDHQTSAGKKTLNQRIADHAEGLKLVIDLLSSGDPLKDVNEIGAVGHRVVHGGEAFTDTVVIDDAVLAAIEEHIALAPLHNPPNLLGIQVAQQILPKVPQVAVFDTAFHQTMPQHAYLYGLPYSYYQDERIRRYGFHGTSHKYVAGRAAALLGKPLEECNLITCHLGNGSSIAAVQNGKSVDTTMGLTPLEGLVMGTRCGDIDPAILFHLARAKGMSIDQLDTLCNKKSGMLGLSTISNDMRELEDLEAQGQPDATRALEVYCYRIRKYIGAYTAALGRVDAVVFTAGVGENSDYVRKTVCKDLSVLGIAIDLDKNGNARGKEIDISQPQATTRVLVIPTNEEKAIAADTFRLAQ